MKYSLQSHRIDLYYLSFPKDRPLLKSFVWSVYAVEVLQIILSVRDAFRCFGSAWGDADILDTIGWQWFSVPTLITFGKLSLS